MASETMTVGELKRHIKSLKDSDKLSFSGGLSFYRLKKWDEDEFIVEFNEPIGFLSDNFKKNNPNVKVVFIDTENTEWNESETVGEIDVNVR